MSNQNHGESRSGHWIQPLTRSGHRSFFTCGEIHTVILATNDLSIYLPFCAENQRKKKPNNKSDCDNSSARVKKSSHAREKKRKMKKVSHPPRKKKEKKERKQMPQLIGSRQYAPKTFRADYLQTVRLGERARCQGEEEKHSVWTNSGSEEAPSLSSSRTVCVRLSVLEVQKKYRRRLFPPPLSRSLSHLLQSPPSPEQATLRRGCAAQKNFRWRMRFTFLP